MPQRKRYHRNKKYRKKKFNNTLYGQVMSIVNRKLEKKFIDTLRADYSTTVGWDAPIISRLTQTVQGTSDAAQRIGDEIELVGMHMAFDVSVPAAIKDCYVRFVYFQWKDDDAAGAPTATSILQGGGTTAGYNSPYDHDNGAQFSIICDKVLRVVGDTNLATNRGECTLNLQKQPYNFQKKVHYNAAGASGKNNIYVLVTCNRPVADNVSINYYHRVTYRDA